MQATSTPRSGSSPTSAGLSARRETSDNSRTATAPTEVPSRSASRWSLRTTSSGTFLRYKVLMSHHASNLRAEAREWTPRTSPTTRPVGLLGGHHRAYGLVRERHRHFAVVAIQHAQVSDRCLAPRLRPRSGRVGRTSAYGRRRSFSRAILENRGCLRRRRGTGARARATPRRRAKPVGDRFGSA